MKLSLAPSLCCAGICVLGYLGWSNGSGRTSAAATPEASEQRLTRATVEPELKLELAMDPFRLSTPGVQKAVAGSVPEIFGPPAPTDVVVAGAEVPAVGVSTTELATAASPDALNGAASTPGAASTSVPGSPSSVAGGTALATTTPPAPLPPQPGDPAALHAVLLAGTVGLAIIDGQVRVRGLDWATPAGTARLVDLASDHVAIDVAGRIVQLSLERTRSSAIKKPGTTRPTNPKRLARRTT